jgi:hypothetical protein
VEVYMQNMSAQALRMAVVNAAATDATFRAELAKDPEKAIRARFGDQALKLRVHFEGENEVPVLIPDKTERLARSVEHVAKDVGDRSPTRGEFEAVIIHRAWSDPAFLLKLKSSPLSAVNELLKTYQSNVPAGANVRVYEEHKGECVVVVPRADSRTELTEAELQEVAGGIPPLIAGAIVGAIASKVVDVVWATETTGD